MAKSVLKELSVRGKIQRGEVPETKDMLEVFTKKDAVELLRSVLMQISKK